MENKELKEYVEKNRDRLENLAVHGEPVIRAMSLTLLKRASE